MKGGGRQQQQRQQSRAFNDLCSLVLTILGSPPPLSLPFSSNLPSTSSSGAMTTMLTGQVSPAGFASLLLGVSLALMLCGSVTFVIGFILMPWVLGLVMVFYFVGLVSSLSVLGRAILCPPKRKEMFHRDWKC